MGYWYYGNMTNGDDAQEFVLSRTRSDHEILVAAVRKVYPDALVDKGGDYPDMTLTAEQAVPLFEAWHKDLEVVIASDYDSDPDPRELGLFWAHNDDFAHFLVDRVAKMLELARQGYGATFQAL